jgi:hypothetical protein
MTRRGTLTARINCMRYRLRTLLIVLALIASSAVTNYCVLHYAGPAADLAADSIVVRLGFKMYPWLRPRGLE